MLEAARLLRGIDLPDVKRAVGLLAEAAGLIQYTVVLWSDWGRGGVCEHGMTYHHVLAGCHDTAIAEAWKGRGGDGSEAGEATYYAAIFRGWHVPERCS